MSGSAKGNDRHLDLVTMGCRWVLDVSALAPDEAAATGRRWQRCRDLASAPALLEDEPETITVAEGQQAYDVSREVTRAGLVRLRGREVLLHAAALAADDGRTLVLVAPSGGGKSTATRVLGQRLGYVSDESVVLLADHRIAPHPKPPSLVVDERERFRKDEPPPDELGLGPTPASPRLGRLLTLARDPEVAQPVISPVGIVDQLIAVLPETSSTWQVPDGLDRLARAVTAGGAPSRLDYAEIDTCHDLLRDHLADDGGDAPAWEHLPPPPHLRVEDPDGSPAAPVGAPVAGTDRPSRAPWSDALAADGEVLVLAGARPLRLAGPGAVLWRAADGSRSVDELVGEVVDALGEHPDAAALVRSAASDLLEHGVLTREEEPGQASPVGVSVGP